MSFTQSNNLTTDAHIFNPVGYNDNSIIDGYIVINFLCVYNTHKKINFSHTLLMLEMFSNVSF